MCPAGTYWYAPTTAYISDASIPVSTSLIVVFIFSTAFWTPLPRYLDLSPSRSSSASNSPVEAPLGAAPRPTVPSARYTSASTVGFPLESSTSLAYTGANAILGVSVAAAKAALDTARINLRYTQVKSPISGQVSLSEVTPGALVTANQAARLTVVQQLDPIYVDVTQSYGVMDKIRRRFADGELTNGGTEAEVELVLDDGAKYAHKGKLTFKDALVNETTGTVRIRAEFPNPERRLMPGQYVRAVINEGVRKNVIKLDQRATMRHTNGKPYVYVLTDDNKVQTRDIVTSGTEGAYWLVDSGLKAGDRVIVGKYSGTTVKVDGEEYSIVRQSDILAVVE